MITKTLTPRIAVDGWHKCQCCGEVWEAEALNDIMDLNQRIEPGRPTPSGECPDPQCGMLCYPVPENTVIIEVLGGVAEVGQCPPDIKVEIIDYDNRKCQ